MHENFASIFCRIALEKNLLDEKQLEQARVLVRLARRESKPMSLDRACVELELLTPEQVRGIERGIRVYVVRKADKIFGRLAVEKGFVDADTVEHCFARQQSELTKNHRLVRLSKLLMGLDAITPEQDAELRKLLAERLTPEESQAEMDAAAETFAEPAPAPEQPSVAAGKRKSISERRRAHRSAV